MSPSVISSLKNQNPPAHIASSARNAVSTVNWQNDAGGPNPLCKREIRGIYYFLFFFLICAVLSIFSAKNNLIGIYQVLKLFEFILLFILAGKLINSLKKLYFCFILILSTGFIQVIISVAQYYKQSSLSLKWLGEPILSPDLAGVAKIVLDGEKIIRAYGTFSHPNVLAGFLLMSLFISFYLLFFTKIKQNWQFLALIGLISVQFLAFILTFSRTAWLASLFSLFCFIIIYYSILLIFSKKLKDKAFLKRGLFERSEFRSKKMSYLSVIIQRLSYFLKNLLKFSFKIVSRETISFFRLVKPSPFKQNIKSYLKNFYISLFQRQSAKNIEKGLGKRKFASLIIIILIISCFSVMLLPQISTRLEIDKNDQAISDRFLFNSFTFEIIKKSPFLGVGMGNFVLNINQIDKSRQFSLEPWQYQPVHNFYLLIAAEIGIIGLILFTFFIFKVLKMAYLKVKSQIVSRETIFSQRINLCTGFILSIFSAFLFIGFFDHYFWTIQQGQLTFWLIAGLLVASCRINETC
jgi:O-antigen ligase